MRYAIDPQARITWYEHDLIVLMISDNKFHVIRNLPDGFLDDLSGSAKTSQFSNVYEALTGIGAVRRCQWGGVGIRANELPKAYLEERWLMPLTPEISPSQYRTMRALFALFRAAYCVKRSGFEGVVSMIAREPSSNTSRADPAVIIRTAVASLNRVFVYDFSGNKCLTYSLALLLMLRRRLPSMRLVVGVKTRPFHSHAWVEHEGRVINDDPDLRNKLAVILEA